MDETTYTVTACKDGYTFAPTTVDIGNDTVMMEVTLTPLTTLKLTAKPNTWKAIGQGEELTYTFTLTLTLKAIDGGTLKNIASLTSTEYPVEVQTSWQVVKPYLSVTVTDTPDPVVMLGTLHYSAQVELSANAPQPTATGVTLTLQLPSGVKLDVVTTTQGTCESTQLPLITCQLTDLSITPIPLLDKEGLGVVSVATVNLDVTLKDAGLLVLTQDATVTATEYPAHTVKTRTHIFVPKDLKVDAVLVLDTTHSMQGELNGVKAALEKFIREQLAPSTSPTIALLGFKDDVTVLAFTKDLPLLQTVIAGLKAEGGGLCPEASVAALNVALDHVKDNGVIFFSTDASPYDDADMEALATRLKTQQVKFNAVVSGDCGEKDS